MEETRDSLLAKIKAYFDAEDSLREAVGMPVTYGGSGTSSSGATVTSQPAPPSISSVASSGVQTTQVTVTWTTDVLADSKVCYSTDHGYGTCTTLDSSLVTSHSVTITGLTANTQYFYVVKSQGTVGGVATSSEGNFTTLASATCGPPTYGCFITNTNVIADPTYSSIPAAGGTFAAADGFSTPAATIIRVTDANTCPGVGTNHFWGSSAEQNVFNQDSTRFITKTDKGGFIPWTLNVSTRTVARMSYVAAVGRSGGGNACESGTPIYLELIPGSTGMPTWGYTVANKDVLFVERSISNQAWFAKLDFNNLAAGYTNIKNLSACGSQFAINVNSQDVSIDGNDEYLLMAGGGSVAQDSWTNALVVRLSDGLCRWLDLNTATVGGDFGAAGAASFTGGGGTCKIHNLRMDKSAKYVIISTSTCTGSIVSQSRVLWDWQTLNVNTCQKASDNGCGGHWASGYTHSYAVTGNSNNGFDVRNAEYRTLPTATASFPISPAFTTGVGTGQDGYFSWNNADSGDTTFPLGTFYIPNAVQSATPKALKGEIAMLDNGNGRYIRLTKTCSNNSTFNNTGRGLISPDGRAFGFTSNYNVCHATGLGRYDAFILVTP
jgi:hypothetical protein